MTHFQALNFSSTCVQLSVTHTLLINLFDCKKLRVTQTFSLSNNTKFSLTQFFRKLVVIFDISELSNLIYSFDEIVSFSRLLEINNKTRVLRYVQFDWVKLLICFEINCHLFEILTAPTNEAASQTVKIFLFGEALINVKFVHFYLQKMWSKFILAAFQKNTDKIRLIRILIGRRMIANTVG